MNSISHFFFVGVGYLIQSLIFQDIYVQLSEIPNRFKVQHTYQIKMFTLYYDLAKLCRAHVGQPYY